MTVLGGHVVDVGAQERHSQNRKPRPSHPPVPVPPPQLEAKKFSQSHDHGTFACVFFSSPTTEADALQGLHMESVCQENDHFHSAERLSTPDRYRWLKGLTATPC
ncbi:hypothetical protein SKAU_G00372950 [Synaphobranchus kaupii]|uniref:Uncharacterized protein n=1 Tax=Synaphobranchus kaupii TaxID=118154 RepID=A0A9Q1EGH0_SYNKA|nr:hypothetical protein SKAU_G00372950 [Synaphobranchus kaupii]